MGMPLYLKRFNYITAIVSGLIILVIGIFTTMEGIVRGVFNHPTTWSLDICQYMLIWAVFLGSAYAFQEKSHVSVEFIREGVGRAAGPGMQRGLSILGYFFSILYVAVLTWSSIDMLQYGMKWNKLTRGTVQIPIVWLYAAILIGSLIMLITLLFIIISLLKGNEDYI